MRFFKNFDFSIVFIIALIAMFGLMIIWSVAPGLFTAQLTSFLLGLILFFVVSGIDIRIFQNVNLILYLVSLLLLIVTYLIGDITRGSTRWIQIGGLTLQSSEIVKPMLILFLASFISKFEDIKIMKFVPLTFILAVPAFLIFKQPDLGSSLVIMAIYAGMILGSGISYKQIGVGLAVVLGIIPVFWLALHDYQKDRILSFLNPNLDPLGTGYNLIQAMITVGSGQLFGMGLGKGTQSHLAFLPERQTDFIFASFTEEFGFVGAAILLVLYILLLYRILTHAQNSTSKFGTFICLGVFSMICFQVFVNVGMNMGILPITGITLPFVSYGGSSVLALMISLGLVEGVAKSENNQRALEIK